LLSHSSHLRELASGVDALYLSGRGALPRVLLDQLDGLKGAAADTGGPVDVALCGYPVRVLGSGWGKYRYYAVHELARVGFTPSDALPCVRVQPTSLGLHALGPDVMVLWVRNLLDALGIDAVLQVARLDLHADFHGLDIAADQRSNFVGYSNRRALYEVDEALSGLNFGTRGGALYARIYDKTRELDGKGDDWWLDIWGSRYDPARPVIRVEYEFSRDGLREFGLDTPEDVFAQMAALWAYAACVWLSLRVPTSDDTRSRWPVDPRWQAVQRATLAGNALPADRIKAGQALGALRNLMPQLVGSLTSAAAHLGTDDLDATVHALMPHMARFEAQTGASFAERVAEKRRRL
jgi:hypothetical protein